MNTTTTTAPLPTEVHLPFATLAKKFTHLGVTPRALSRWHARGIRGTHLEATRVGGVTKSSVEAVDRFLAKLNG